MEYLLRCVLENVLCPVTITFKEKEYHFNNGKEALSLKNDNERLIKLHSIDAKNGELIVIAVESDIIPLDMNSKWAKEFYKQNGRFPDPFDGA